MADSVRYGPLGIGRVWSGAVWQTWWGLADEVRRGTTGSGLARYGTADAVGHGQVRFSTVWLGTVWQTWKVKVGCGRVGSGEADWVRHGQVGLGGVRYGLIRCGSADTVR